MSLSFYSSLMTADGDAPNHDEQPQFTALNLFAALATNHLKYYTPWQLNVHHFNDRVELAGKGGSAVVEIGQLRKFRVKREANNQQFVAVKRSRALAAAAGSLDEKVILRHFEQLTMEIRIMGNSTLRKHANIVNILGVCVDVINAIPSLALVLEHSDLGSLDLFLVTGDGKGTTELERVDMALQVAEGLTALHGLGICHADVKTQNALVFQKSNHDSWLIKISDFGNSVIGVHGNARARVRCHIGTRLLNAPEIRNGSALRDPLFSIEDALRTDVFSFGLLVWEVLKCVQSFLDSAWIGNAAGASSIDEIEDVLNTLNHNALRDSAVNFLNGLELGDGLRARLSRIFRGALDDNPSDRVTMVTLRDLLREERELEPYKQFANSLDDLPGGIPADETSRVEDINNELLGLEPLYEDSMGTWTAQHSLYELLSHCGFDGNRIIQEMPTTIKKQILEELEIVASATSVPNNIRAGAAMTLSECYTIGFGSNLDNDKAVRWLRTSASLGSTKAALWYHRVCCATGINPATSELVSDIGQDLEQQLSSLPSVLYLAERIRRLNFQVQESAKKVTLIARLTPSPAARLEDAAFKLSIFNPDEVDDLSPLHLACWLGDNELVSELIKRGNPGLKSTLGLDAVHFACLGGHISTLRLLVEQHKLSVMQAGFHGITALHLAIFFPRKDLVSVVDLILTHAASLVTSTTSDIKWEAHDLVVTGTPLEWATITRNQDLVQLLIPHDRQSKLHYLRHGARGFFWEIVEIVAPLIPKDLDADERDLIQLSTIEKPFSHWIAHGKDHAQAIEKTIQVYDRHGWIGFRIYEWSHLLDIVYEARCFADLHLVNAILDVSSGAYVKQCCLTGPPFSNPVLLAALQMSGQDTAWYDTICKIVDFYTIEELEREYGPHEFFLNEAIAEGSLVGVRALLERGVNIYSPSMRGSYAYTPIHQCIHRDASIEMFELLIEFGASLQEMDPILGRTALQSLLLRRRQRPLLNVLLRHEHEDQVLINALHSTLRQHFSDFRGERDGRRYWSENLRYALTHPRLMRHINSADGDGCTMVQRASWSLHLETTRLLLNAQADASIPFIAGDSQALPLQLACTQGRHINVVHTIGPEVDFLNAESQAYLIRKRRQQVGRERLKQALQVAKELLQWHHARGDGLFSGITELHLAYRMKLTTEISELLRAGMDPDQKGRWPGCEDDLTAQDLGKQYLLVENEVDQAFSALQGLILPEGSELPPDMRQRSDSASTGSEDI